MECDYMEGGGPANADDNVMAIPPTTNQWRQKTKETSNEQNGETGPTLGVLGDCRLCSYVCAVASNPAASREEMARAKKVHEKRMEVNRFMRNRTKESDPSAAIISLLLTLFALLLHRIWNVFRANFSKPCTAETDETSNSTSNQEDKQENYSPRNTSGDHDQKQSNSGRSYESNPSIHAKPDYQWYIRGRPGRRWRWSFPL